MQGTECPGLLFFKICQQRGLYSRLLQGFCRTSILNTFEYRFSPVKCSKMSFKIWWPLQVHGILEMLQFSFFLLGFYHFREWLCLSWWAENSRIRLGCGFCMVGQVHSRAKGLLLSHQFIIILIHASGKLPTTQVLDIESPPQSKLSILNPWLMKAYDMLIFWWPPGRQWYQSPNMTVLCWVHTVFRKVDVNPQNSSLI